VREGYFLEGFFGISDLNVIYCGFIFERATGATARLDYEATNFINFF